MAVAGLIIPEADDDKAKERNILDQYLGGGYLNFSGFKRWMQGEDTKPQNNDTMISLYYFGIMGALAKMYGTLEQKKQENPEMGYGEGLMIRGEQAFVNGIKNNVFGSTSNLLNAVNMGGSYMQNWLRGMTGVGENAFIPSEVQAFSKAVPENKIDLSQGTTIDKLTNDLKTKVFLGGELPSKIGMWGDKIENTTNKTYAGRVLSNLFDIRNPKQVDTNKFGYQLMLQFQKTGDAALFPSHPKNTFKYDGEEIKLDPKQYEQFQILVGNNRKTLVEPLLDNQTDIDINDISHDELVKELTSRYDEGYENAKQDFIELNPQLGIGAKTNTPFE